MCSAPFHQRRIFAVSLVLISGLTIFNLSLPLQVLAWELRGLVHAAFGWDTSNLPIVTRRIAKNAVTIKDGGTVALRTGQSEHRKWLGFAFERQWCARLDQKLFAEQALHVTAYQDFTWRRHRHQSRGKVHVIA